MENLINEQDFVKPVKYNPWKRFVLFYVLAILNIATIYVTATFFENNIITAIIIMSMVLLFFTMPFIMIFHKKEIMYSSKKTIASGICLLLFMYFLTYIATDVIENGLYFLLYTGYLTNFLILCVFLGYGLLCSGIILLIINRKRKKHAKPY